MSETTISNGPAITSVATARGLPGSPGLTGDVTAAATAAANTATSKAAEAAAAAVNASSSADAAATSAAAALTQAVTSANAATSSSASQVAAATSASNAQTHANITVTQAGSATTSAIAGAGSAAQAAASASEAAAYITAIKPPCVVATIANVTLSGLQTIDSVVLGEGDRVVVGNQTDLTENGIRIASAGSWERALDFNEDVDVSNGTLVAVSSASSITFFEANFSTDPVVFGTTEVVFSEVGVAGPPGDDGDAKNVLSISDNSSVSFNLVTFDIVGGGGQAVLGDGTIVPILPNQTVASGITAGQVDDLIYLWVNASTGVLGATHEGSAIPADVHLIASISEQSLYSPSATSFSLTGSDGNSAPTHGSFSDTKSLATIRTETINHDKDLADAGLANYTGSDDLVPIYAAAGEIHLGVNRVTGEVKATGLSGTPPPLAPVSLTTPVAVAAINHHITYGQSLSLGAKCQPAFSLTQPYSNICFNGGPRAYNDFSSFKPLVEDDINTPGGGATTGGETPCSGAANYASTLFAIENGGDPEDYVILASAPGKGGAQINALTPGSNWWLDHLTVHIDSAYALNNDYAVPVYDWMQGSSDAAAGTPEATYKAHMINLQSEMETYVSALNGQTEPIYCLMMQTNSYVTTSEGTLLAQMDLARTDPKFFMVTPTYHLALDADNIHLQRAASKLLGVYHGRARKQIIHDHVEPESLFATSATVRGDEVTIRFKVPQGPIVIDHTDLASTLDSGLVILDGVSVTTITSITTTGSDVTCKLSAVPTGDVTVRYAMDNLGTGLTLVGGASGNLRDSTSGTVNILGDDYPIYHVALAFKLSAVTLGE